jgi:hypothetical protein
MFNNMVQGKQFSGIFDFQVTYVGVAVAVAVAVVVVQVIHQASD